MERETVAEYKLKSGNILKIYPDESADSPRDWDNLGVMVCFHKRYNLGDKHDYREGDYGSWDEVEKAIIEKENPVVILPLYLYDHSGIRMKVGSFQGLLSQGHAHFDSGQVGFIFAPRDKVLKEHGVEKISQSIKETVEKCLQGEVETYDQYLRGDVYGFCVVKPTHCDECGNDDEEEVDSCWGFYGDDPKKNGMMDHIKDEIIEEIKG
jgi:hypothetical protein